LHKISSKDITRDLERGSFEQTKNSISAKGSLELASRAIKEGDFSKALFHLEKGLEVEPDNPLLVTLSAKVLIWLKEYQEALEYVDYILNLNPQDEDALNARKILNSILYYHRLVTQFPIYS